MHGVGKERGQRRGEGEEQRINKQTLQKQLMKRT